MAFDFRGENNCDIQTNGELLVLKKYISNGDVIFDAGANIGEWTKYVLKISPEAKIHCFEPCRGTFQMLKNNVGADAKLNNFGLSDKPGEADFFVVADGAGTNSLFCNAEIQKKERVILNSVDNYCAQQKIPKINFLKIDVEGGEFSVLRGADNLLKNGMIDFVQFEYNRTYIDANIRLLDVFNYFSGKPYKYFLIKYNRLESIAHYSQDLENFQLCNYLFVNEKITL